MRKDGHVRIHSVLSWLIVHPVLQKAHFAAPATWQPEPDCATPFSHVHVFAANQQHTIYANKLAPMPLIGRACTNVRMHLVLSWLSVHPVVHRKHFAAPFTLHAGPTCGKPFVHVHTFSTKARYLTSQDSFCACSYMQSCVEIPIHLVLSWLIVQPVLHTKHLAAPFTVQSAPVCGNPLSHTHAFTTKARQTTSAWVYHALAHTASASATRTNAFCSVLATRKAAVTNHALRGAVHITAHTNFW